MDNLNRRFNQTNNAMIGFYMKCDPTYINNSTHVIKTFTGASLLMAANNDAGSFNVHIIGSFADPFTAGFSIPFLNASMIPSGSYLNSTANGDLAHEIGHLLGLSHTHQYSAWNWKCLTECVSRTRTWPLFNLCPTRLISNRVCEATGDGLRDTQADNNLINNSSCTYDVTFGNDEWGDSYDNPPAGLQDRANVHNIMSYNSATDCVDQFSRLQIAVMLWTANTKLNNHSGWANPISTFDSYEPDNEAVTARNILINEVQERNFHQQWNRYLGNNFITQCDVDWITFTPTCNGSFDVQTFENIGHTKANTRLTLFDANLNQLAQNDDISTSNHFSKITFNFVTGQTYFISVENISINVTGYYNLKVATNFIISPNTNQAPLCSGTTYMYSLTGGNLGSGAAVWSINPASAATIQNLAPNGQAVNITAASTTTNIPATIYASINNNCPTLSTSVTVIPDAPLPYTCTDIGFDPNVGYGVCTKYVCYPAGSYNPLTLTIPNHGLPNIATWHWTIINGVFQGNVTDMYVPYNMAFYNIVYPNSNGTTCTVMVRPVNSCGKEASSEPFKWIIVSYICPLSQTTFTVSPNPSSTVIKISTSGTSDNVKSISSPDGFSEIEIFDKMGNLKKRLKYSKGTKFTTIDVSSLPTDNYVLRIFNGVAWEEYKVIIQR
jgi:hypothetical protein